MEPTPEQEDDLRPEYDLTQLKGGVRGKYAHRFAKAATSDYELTSGIIGTESKPMPPGQQAFLERVSQALRPVVRQSVTPIGWSMPDGRFGVMGTGTFLRIANTSFLVTASHVLDEANEHDAQLSICDVGGGWQVPLQGRVIGHDKCDIALWELNQAILDAIPNRVFLNLKATNRESVRDPRGIYCIYGFPVCQSEADATGANLSTVPTTIFTGLYGGETASLADFDPHYHILLDKPTLGGLRLDKGPLPEPSSLKGVSGSSLWRIACEGMSAKHWTFDDAIIVGIQTGVYRSGTIVKGTRWWAVERLIREMHPELAGPLSLVVPSTVPSRPLSAI